MTDQSSLLTALLAVQKQAPALKKTATNPHYKSSYAPLDAIVEAINPILQKNQLVWTTLPGVSDYGPALTYRLLHVPSGESLEGTMPLLLSKQDAQGQGSAITYARRYALCAVLNLVAEDDDDGGRASQGARSQQPTSAPGRPSQKQMELARNLIQGRKATITQLQAILKEIGVDEDFKITQGWLSRLSGGRDGEMSQLITRLTDRERPLPGAVRQGDIPEPAAGEFEHPPATPDDVPFT